MLKLLEKENLGLDDIASAKPRQVLVCLCLDCSYSMRTNGKIDQLNKSVRKFIEQNAKNPYSCNELDLCIIAYGGDSPKVVCDFTNIQKVYFEDLKANGITPMGEAVNLALDKIIEERKLLRQEGTAIAKPLLFIFGDGKDSFPDGEAMKEAVANTQALVSANKLNVECVGVGNFDKSDLERFCPGKEVITFKELEMEQVFEMLSKSTEELSTECGDDWKMLR